MIQLLLFLFYNLLFFPVLFIVYHSYALFRPKYRKGILGRYGVIKAAEKFRNHLDNASRDLYLIHCASMGEFEHLKPFVRRLKERLPKSRTVVMFFSPSGYENVKSAPGVDLIIYSPFDWWFPVYRFLRILRPKALLIAKYDVWPNLMWFSVWRKIPRFLVNATLYDRSSRLKWPLRWLLRPVYGLFDGIFAISEKDRHNFDQLSGKKTTLVVGDTKYDQVVFRSEESRKKNVLPPEIHDNRMVFVAGSTWPEDEEHLLPAIRHYLEISPETLVIICPHEPTAAHLAQLENGLSGLAFTRLSQIENSSEQLQVLLIDRIGVLANLYSLADVAYVGGSFKQNIHNVLEPAVYGIPVLFGPVNQNSHEAQLLKNCGGAIEISGTADLQSHIEKLFSDADFRQQTGAAAQKLVAENRGATDQMLDAVMKKLSGE
ncbi:MAG: glycosyltransferase N-terminal domain-containing protein [Calditrichia bacterium]